MSDGRFFSAVKETVSSIVLNVLGIAGHTYEKNSDSQLLSAIGVPSKLSNTPLLLHTMLKYFLKRSEFCYTEVL